MTCATKENLAGETRMQEHIAMRAINLGMRFAMLYGWFQRAENPALADCAERAMDLCYEISRTLNEPKRYKLGDLIHTARILDTSEEIAETLETQLEG